MSDSQLAGIAIVGYGCRFPGACGPAAFAALLRDGRDAISEVPAARWDAARYHDPSPRTPGRSVSRWGGFLDRIEEFDAAFFGISPREAARMDPQQRLLLEVTWEALEDAGLPAEALAASRTGVFVGAIGHDFALLRARDAARIDGYTPLGTLGCIAANRLSYYFDLRGPSLTVDCACSSSLMAVHLACRSLEAGECALAVAGGANVLLAPEPDIAFSQAGLLSPTGRCRAFAAGADGYVRAEGAGVVILKPLATALADGDRVHAVIRATACNQGGRTNGLSAPSGAALEALLRAAWARAGVDPSTAAFVEAQGTGTPLGDAIEARALGAVFGAGRPADRPCHVGAVKTNVGHLEMAAGIAALMKTVLSVEQRTIFRNLHADPPSSAVPWDALSLHLPAETTPWPEGPAVAGVTTFGLGGSNVHVVVEAAADPPARAPAASAGALLLALSARSAEALRVLAAAWIQLLDGLPPESLAAAAYTAALRRGHHAHRLAVVFRSDGELRARIRAFLDGAPASGWAAGHRPGAQRNKLAFLFPAGGAILDETLRDAAPAREALAAFAEAARSLAVPLDGDAGAPARHLGEQLALAALLRARGLSPTAALGRGAAALRPRAGPGGLAECLRAPPAPIAPEGLLRLASEGYERFVVLGAATPEIDALAAALRSRSPTALLVPALRDGEQPYAAFLEALGALYAAGLAVRFDGLYGPAPRVVDLPHHPWLRRRHWLDPAPAEPPPVAEAPPAAPSQPPAPTLFELLAAVPADARHGLLVDELCADLAGGLGLERTAVDPERPFFELGLDSILAAELVSHLERRLGHPLTASTLLSHPNVDTLAQALLGALFPVQAPLPPPADDAGAELAAIIAGVEGLTDAEVAALGAAASLAGLRAS